MRAIFVSIALFLASAARLFAQDPTFSHGYYNPVYLNPALAGNNSGMRVILNDKRQWRRVPGVFNTTSFSIDLSEPCYSVGLGISGMRDVEGEGFLTTTKMGFTGSWSRPLVKRKLDFGAGFTANYAQKSIDWTSLEFSDQFDPILGKIQPASSMNPLIGKGYLDVDAGIQLKLLTDLGFNKTIMTHFGFAARHINRPDDALIGNSRQPARFTLHTASIIPYGRKWREKGNFFLPYMIYQWQDFTAGRYAIQREFLVGAIGFTNPLVYGVFYHNGKLPLLVKNVNQLGLLVGYQQPFRNSSYSWQANYSYDFTLTGLGFSNTGTHEISLLIFIDGVSLFCKGSNVIEGASKCFRDKRSGFIPQI